MGTPLDTVWIHRSRNAQPLPNHSWAEIVHCSAGPAAATNYRGILYPMWAYGAPGSGLSVNLGRTLVASSFEHAIVILHQIYGEVRADGNGTVPTSLSTDLLTRYDSIQIVKHLEYFSNEIRHEIVMLHRREYERIDGLSDLGAGFMCGRYPKLFPCRVEDYARHSQCHAYLSRQTPPGLIGTRRCGNSNPKCFKLSDSMSGWQPKESALTPSGLKHTETEGVYYCDTDAVAGARAHARGHGHGHRESAEITLSQKPLISERNTSRAWEQLAGALRAGPKRASHREKKLAP